MGHDGAEFSKINPSFFTIKEGSTSHLGLLSSGEKKETALLGARNRYALRLADHQRSTPCYAGWDRMETEFLYNVSTFIEIAFNFLQISNLIFMYYRIITYIYKFRIAKTYIWFLYHCCGFIKQTHIFFYI